MLKALLTVALLACLCLSAQAAEWYVAPKGTPDGDGSAEKPWDLQTAMKQPAAVKPGDTIWLQAGQYEGAFQVRLVGTAEKPILVRAYKNDHVTIRGHLEIGYNFKAEYCTIWGLEIVSRGAEKDPDKGADGVRISHSESKNPGIKVINCVIHDNGSCGVATWAGGTNNEVYGCLIYNNGYDDGTRGHGYGFYVQSQDGPKRIKDTIIFRNFNQGTQLYGSAKAYRDNVTHEGNTWFNNSEPSLIGGRGQSLVNTMWIEGGRLAPNCNLIGNLTYAAPWAKTINNHLGNSKDSIVKDNYFVAAAGDPANAFSLHAGNEGLKMEGNTFYGKISGFKPDQFGPNNAVLTTRPAAPKVFVRPNAYEPGRANITIYNWPSSKTVEVDISKAGLKNGDKFEVRDAQNFYGKPVLAGTYDGKPLVVPMTGLTVAPLVGLPASYKTPEHTAPEFGAFVLVRAGAVQ